MRQSGYVCSDMWKPYLAVIARNAGQAVHVLDCFHIMAHFSKALDEVRAGEVKELKAMGYEPVLSKTRWLLLRRPDTLFDKQEIKLAELLQCNLRSVRTYLPACEGGVSVLLERHLSLVGGPVPGQMVYQDDAIED